jgi:hypothetical protein
MPFRRNGFGQENDGEQARREGNQVRPVRQLDSDKPMEMYAAADNP